jgi:hypothetical protein
MRLFCSIKYLRETGYALLPAMLLLASKEKSLDLWAPAPAYVDDLHDRGLSNFTSRDILEFIDEGRIRIFAREFWFDKNARNKRFESEDQPWSKWNDEFDGELVSPMKNGDHRIVILEKERGWEWAREQLGNDTDSARLAQNLYDKRSAAPGTIERADGRASDEAVLQILRDAHNTSEVFDICGADLIVEGSAGAD